MQPFELFYQTPLMLSVCRIYRKDSLKAIGEKRRINKDNMYDGFSRKDK